MSHLTSILLPSWNRSRWLSRCLLELYATVGANQIEVLVSLVEGDSLSAQVAEQYPTRRIFRTESECQRGSVYAWNELGALAQGDVLALFADDLVPTEGWLERALIHLDMFDKEGVLIGFNDLGTDGSIFAAHWLASRSFLLKYNGGVIYPPMYHSWWCDRELTERAKREFRHIWARDVVVEHRHYTFNKSEIDPTYAEGIKYHESDRLLYLERQAAGYPNDFDPVLVSSENADISLPG